MDNSFNEDKAVGDNGETAVSYLIKSMPNWKCIKFGVENHIEELKKTVREKLNPVTRKIKSMPDFVAFNTETGETYFIEVKYRSNTKEGKYILNYLDAYNKYWEGTKLIIVRPIQPHFVYVNLEKIKPNMKKPLEVSQNMWKEYWDFTEIQKDIKDIFPKLSDLW